MLNDLRLNKRLLFLALILLSIPLTIILALTQTKILKFAGGGPEIASVAIHPGSLNTSVGQRSNMSTLAYDSLGNPVFSGVSYEWSMSSTNSVGTLSKTTGEITEFSALEYGCGQITVIARKGIDVVTKSTSASVANGNQVPDCSDSTSPSPTPTPTTPPSSTVLRIPLLKLHGIGSGGDNTNPNLPGNQNPLRTTRTLIVELYDQSNNPLPTSQGNIDYSVTNGYFSGDIPLNSGVPSGNYLVKVKSQQFLRKQVPGIITITTNTLNQLPQVSLVTGDMNNDNALTIADYNILVGCFSDLLPPKNCDEAQKSVSDISDDGKVNADDYNLFLRELSQVSGD